MCPTRWMSATWKKVTKTMLPSCMLSAMSNCIKIGKAWNSAVDFSRKATSINVAIQLVEYASMYAVLYTPLQVIHLAETFQQVLLYPWYFITFFIIQHIALTPKGLFSSFKSSVVMAFKKIIEIMGGSLVLLLIPLVFSSILFIYIPKDEPLLLYFRLTNTNLISTPFLLIFSIITHTFQTKLYLSQK